MLHERRLRAEVEGADPQPDLLVRDRDAFVLAQVLWRRLKSRIRAMTGKTALSEYLVLSRGQWDKDLPPETIQDAIDSFYAWADRLIAEGKMKAGQRLAREGKLVSKKTVIDGPFAEAKEVIGGYWFFLANSLEEAAALAAENPCLACGLAYEVRPIEPARASAFVRSNETPE